jgi:thiamine pyrophosphokinase
MNDPLSPSGDLPLRLSRPSAGGSLPPHPFAGLNDAEVVRCALLISGSPRGVAPALVSRLAETTDFIVAVDSGAELVRQAGLTPDLLLGDFDSISPATLAAFRAAGVECATYDAYKDATDIELALEELRHRGFTAVLATNVLGGRVDHELASLGSLAAAAEQGMAVTVVEERESCVFLSAASERMNGAGASASSINERPKNGVAPRATLRLDFSRTKRPAFISLIPWGGEATVSISGVEWELDHAPLAPTSSRGVSNTPKTTQVQIKAHQGTLIAILEFHE